MQENEPHLVMVTELLQDGSIEISETQAHNIMKQLDELNQFAMLYKFDEIAPGRPLVEHVEQYIKTGSKMGPWVTSSLLECTDSLLKMYGFTSLEPAQDFM